MKSKTPLLLGAGALLGASLAARHVKRHGRHAAGGPALPQSPTAHTEESAPKPRFFSHRLQNGTGKSITIHTVAHVAPPVLYENLKLRLELAEASGHVTHYEGMTGMPAKLGRRFGALYPLMASFFKGKVVENADGTTTVVPATYVTQPKPPSMNMVHDATWSQLGPLAKLTVHLVSRVTGFLVWASKDPDSELGREVAKMFKEGMETLGERDDSRSQRLLASILGGVRERVAVEAALAEESSVDMVWGAAHLPSFLRRFEKHGYRLASSKALL